jgi:hypothetical protein
MDDDMWYWQRSWEGYSGAAGVSCYRGPQSHRYLGLVNSNNHLEFWYQEKDPSAKWLKCKFRL